MPTSASDLIADIDTYLNNPAALQQAILNFTQKATDNQYLYVDPTNPVVNCIEASVLTSAATVNSYQSVLRKQYATLAQTWDDLFLHMSDMDYLNRFAVPNKTTFTLMFRKSEILSKMVTDPITGYKKITIPRNSYFTVSETRFCIEYPIEIQQLHHGEIQVIYNTDIASPIQELTTNQIKVEERQDNNNNRFISFDIDVIQLSVNSKIFDLNSMTSFSTDFDITDQYYYTRVFLMGDDGAWNEVYTTHSDLVYDINTFTAVLKVTDQTLNVSVPEIYVVDATNSRKLRVDVYETKGPLLMMLGNYPASSFGATWSAIDKSEIDQFVAPLETLDTQIVYSTQTVSGGKDGLTFDELRDRIITNAIGNPLIPISNVQIESALEDENYEIVKNVDIITNRIYLATRELPDPSNDKLITAANASIQTGLFSMEDATLINTVIDNGDAITIGSNSIFQNDNGKVTLVDNDTLNYITNLPNDQKAIYLNGKDYFYTPFHYVLDATDNQFDVRAYYLDNPTIESKVFVAQNDTTLLYVTISSYKIEKSTAGFKITIELSGSDDFNSLNDSEVFVQLRFKAAGQTDYAFQNGTYLGLTSNNNRAFSFDLSTNFNIDNNNYIELTKFLMYTEDPKILGAALFQEFDVIFSTSRAMDTQYIPNEVDQALGKFLLPAEIAGISIETLRVQFGYYLERLWARARTVVSENAYARYTTDILKYYTANVYETDPQTGSTIFIENGAPVQHLLHAQGDPVLNEQGQQVYEHMTGDVMTDTDGNPIISSPRKLYRQIDYMLVEAAYWYATDSAAVSYRTEMTDIFVDWIINSLTEIQDKLLEQTKIYFYPKTTTGQIDIMVKNGITTTMGASQSFLLTLSVNDTNYANIDLRNQLKIKSIEIINDELKQSVFSISRLISNLTDAYGDDVIDVEISGLGGEDNNYTAVTILNDTDRPSIRKLLKVQGDNSLIVDEAVEMNFVRHALVS